MCDEETAALARAVGRGLAEAGFTVVTGGEGGAMEHASHGAREAGGTVVGVLPGTIAVVVLGDAVMSGEFNPTLFAVSVAGAAVGMAGSAIAARRVPGPSTPPVADAD